MPTVTKNGPLVVSSNLWKREKYATHNGHRVEFNSNQQARDFAKANGYSGIQIEFNGGSHAKGD